MKGEDLVLALAWPAGSSATAPNSQAASYKFFIEVPNIAMASNGDTIAITGEGDFAVHPKSASGGGEFTHTFAGGGSASGTWTVRSCAARRAAGLRSPVAAAASLSCSLTT